MKRWNVQLSWTAREAETPAEIARVKHGMNILAQMMKEITMQAPRIDKENPPPAAQAEGGDRKRSSALLVGSLLSSDDFSDLLAFLPDDFFTLADDAREIIWKRILARVIHGESNPAELVRLALPENSTTALS